MALESNSKNQENEDFSNYFAVKNNNPLLKEPKSEMIFAKESKAPNSNFFDRLVNTIKAGKENIDDDRGLSTEKKARRVTFSQVPDFHSPSPFNNNEAQDNNTFAGS